MCCLASTQDPYIAFMEYLQRRHLFAGRKSTSVSPQREWTAEGVHGAHGQAGTSVSGSQGVGPQPAFVPDGGEGARREPRAGPGGGVRAGRRMGEVIGPVVGRLGAAEVGRTVGAGVVEPQ